MGAGRPGSGFQRIRSLLGTSGSPSASGSAGSGARFLPVETMGVSDGKSFCATKHGYLIHVYQVYLYISYVNNVSVNFKRPDVYDV